MGNFEYEKSELPSTLDVVAINDRLAQVVSPRMVTWLDSSKSQDIDFNDYDIRRGYTESIVIMKDYFEKYPNQSRLRDKVHWGDGDDDKLKDQVTFFGWLTSK
jgi:hypothetical protein